MGETRRLDIALSIAAAADSVKVTATTVEVPQSSAELGAVIGDQQIRELHLNGRNWATLMKLTPGAIDTGTKRNCRVGLIRQVLELLGKSLSSSELLARNVETWAVPSDMPATRSSLYDDLARIGVKSEDVLMIHASVRAVGPVTGGANVIVQALMDAIGPTGTLAAYVDFEPFYTECDEEVPVFDKRIAHAARDHGVLHETMRKWPGALRSDHPDAGVVAIGARAEWIIADHPFQYGYGNGSPFDKILQAHGRVLMLGAPLDTITLLHYAEHKAQIPDKRIRRYRRLMPGVRGPEWVQFEEFDTAEPVNDGLPSNCFEMIATDYLARGRGSQGPVGAATSFLFDGRDLMKFGIEWLERFSL